MEIEYELKITRFENGKEEAATMKYLKNLDEITENFDMKRFVDRVKYMPEEEREFYLSLLNQKK